MYNHKKSSRDLTNTIFISVGTSSQCTVLSDEEISVPVHPYAEKRYFHPRFGKLMCAASLNGGNVIDHFVKAGLQVNLSENCKVRWVFPMAFVSILRRTEFRSNGPREDAKLFMH